MKLEDYSVEELRKALEEKTLEKESIKLLEQVPEAYKKATLEDKIKDIEQKALERIGKIERETEERTGRPLRSVLSSATAVKTSRKPTLRQMLNYAGREAASYGYDFKDVKSFIDWSEKFLREGYLRKDY